MDWINGISMLLAAVGGISGISAFLYYKPRKKMEDLNVNDKQINVVDQAMKTLVEVQTQLTGAIIEIGRLTGEIGILTESDGELWQIVRLQTRVLEKQIPRKQYAESNICTVADCELRIPPIGTYKTGNSDKEMEEVMIKIRKLQDDKRTA